MEKYTKDALEVERNMGVGFRLGRMGRDWKENGLMGR